MTSDREEFFEILNEYAMEELAKARAPGHEFVSGRLPTNFPQSFFVNPYDFTSQQGLWRERRTALTWDTLRVMAEKNPIISSIINTRVRQVSAFTAPVSESESTGNDQLGYRIKHIDPNKKLSKSDERQIAELEQFIQRCGVPPASGNRIGRDCFDTWLKKIVRDSLTFDAAVAELIPTKKGGLHSFYAVDASTVRLASVQEDDTGIDDKKFVQVVNGQIVTYYEPDEIIYCIRNPTTNIRNNGYGISELEQLVSIVTNLFNAMTHNSQFFKNGAAIKGLINIKKTGNSASGVPQDQLEAFKRAWKAMVTGSANAWTTPIMQSEGVEFVNMGATNREMEFIQYLDFLVKIACAVYSIDPGEIGFYMSAGSGGNAPMFESNQEAKLQMSKDKGLRPLLASAARWINEGIISAITSDYKFVWVGIDSKDQKDVVELRSKEVGSYITVDEAREEAGRDPLGEENGGNIILNPQYLQYLQQKSMAAQMGGSFGGGDDEEGGGEPEFGENTESEDAEAGGKKKEALKKLAGSDEEEIKKSLYAAKTKYLRIMIDG